MFKEIFQEMFHPSKAAIISSLKRSDGLPVSEVAKQVDMSYMGVKQHCINLEKMGFLESWRVPRKEVGRPEKLYRLTSKCDELFPTAGAEVSVAILKQAEELFGSDAPEKLLKAYFQKKQALWAQKIDSTASLEEKVQTISKLREDDGYFNSINVADANSISITEYHNPYFTVLEKYPVAIAFEQDIFEELVGMKVERTLIEGAQGQQQTLYAFAKKKVA